jgi:hypothetical protein
MKVKFLTNPYWCKANKRQVRMGLDLIERYVHTVYSGKKSPDEITKISKKRKYDFCRETGYKSIEEVYKK